MTTRGTVKRVSHFNAPHASRCRRPGARRGRVAPAKDWPAVRATADGRFVRIWARNQSRGRHCWC